MLSERRGPQEACKSRDDSWLIARPLAVNAATSIAREEAMPEQKGALDARSLPEEYYGGFDVKLLPDGSKRYRLPHTLYGSVMHVVTGAKALAATAAAAFIAVALGGAPVDPDWLGWVIAPLAIHAGLTLIVTVFALFAGWRYALRITLRPDGLILNDKIFFPARHVWVIHYGTTYNEGKADEVFVPRLEIQIGTERLLLAEHLDPAAGRLFERLFSGDVRRYWHGHN